MTSAEAVSFAISVVRGVISLAEALGHRDAVIVALEGVLAASRAQTDRDIERKHRRDEPTLEVLVPKERER